jgi:NAD(P)-dependent dehydrogenase (short-subunit alcohol dehydrogenase family)/acyl carrier protein
VSLSGYPYERRRYWIEAGQAISMGAAVRSQRVEDWLYAPVWSTSSLVAGRIAALQDQSFSDNGVAILLSDDSVLIDTLVSQIQFAHPALPIIKVRRADSYRKIDLYHYEINPMDTAHYDAMVEEIKAQNWQPELVLHGWGIRTSHTEQLVAIDFERDIYSLFHLSHALEQFSNTVELKLLANNLSAVDADDQINAEHAGILPVSQIISSEFPNLRCHTIDLHYDGIELNAKMQKLLGQVVLASQDDYISVLKDGRCWKRTFEQLEIPNTPENSHLKEHGIYIITGGLGGIGLSLAELLADKYSAKLVLTGRSDLPDESNDVAPHDAAKLAKIKLLEEKGAEVTYIQCDVTDEISVGNLISRVEAQIGPINGVIHSAGVPGGGLMALRTIDEIQSVLAPKVSGTANLVNHLAGKELDFFVMCSSLASIVGEVAQFEYSAANAYLDAIAHKFSQSSTQFISINWDAWGESGMAFTAELPEWMKVRQQTDLADAISNEEGRRVFERILQNNFTQVAVSRVDVNTMLSQNVELELDQEQPDISLIQHSRPELDTEYVAPQSEMEFRLVKIIQDALGVEPVGLKDNFFELGCDSLLLVKVVALINTQWGTRLSLKMLFDHPCVEAVVGMIHGGDDNDVQVREYEDIVEEGWI